MYLMDENKCVNDIDPGILYKIQLLLKEKRWQDHLKASSINSLDFNRYVEETGNSKHVNLERTLLDYCSNIPITEFIKWLEIINLEEALLMLKEDEPLKIIKEPDRVIEIIVGEDEKLILSCKAQGFPTPRYEWFHEVRKLSEGAVLEISPIRYKDAGLYCCQVSNLSRNGIKTMLFTSGTRVIVNPPQVNNLPKIEKQPYSPTTQKVYPGTTFTVTCKATSEYPISYQWYCNGDILKGKVNSKLDIEFHSNDVYEKKRIECVVSNKCGSILSNSIILEFENEEYYAEDKFALLIGNSEYDYLDSLAQPAKDICVLTQLLKSIGFKTFCFQNLTCEEMRKAIKMFCSFLRPGVYALFYFAGHGYQQSGRYSLLGKEIKDLMNGESICREEILNSMQQRSPEVNVILLDTCRKPSGQPDSDKNTYEENFEYGLLGNTIIAYATSSPHNAYEIQNQSSIFVQHLKIHIKECIPIRDMLFKVIEDVKEDPANCSLQHPSLEESLTHPLKLTDTIIGCGELYELEKKRWQSITGVLKEQLMTLKDLDVNIVIKFSLYQGIVCNAMTINVYVTTLPGYRAEDYKVCLEFYNVASEEEQTSVTNKMKPDFSISLFDLQRQEIIWGKLLLYQKEKNCICYNENFCVVPEIAKVLAH